MRGLRRFLGLGLVGLVVAGHAFGFSFGLTPNADGQLDPWAYGDWQWSDSLGASVDLRTKSSVTLDDDPVDGYDQSVTSAERSLRLQVDPLVFTLVRGGGDGGFGLSTRLGLGLHTEWWDVRETGFLDIDDDGNGATSALRLFFTNNRKILAVKPAITVRLILGDPDSKGLILRGHYIPWVYIQMNHELSSSADGTLWDTPLTTKDFTASTTNSWSLAMQGSLGLGLVQVSVDAGVEGGDYQYEMLIIGGETGSTHVYMVDSYAVVNLTVPSISFSGLSPKLGVGVSRNDTTDLSGEKPVASVTIKPLFSIGLSAR